MDYHCNACPEIDVVYTWVNGSDPSLVEQLIKTREQIQNSIQKQFYDQTNKSCLEENLNKCNVTDGNCLETPILLVSPGVPESNRLFTNATPLETIDSRGTLLYFDTVDQGTFNINITLKRCIFNIS